MIKKNCLFSFTETKSSNGSGLLWTKILGFPKDIIVTFDSIEVYHGKPSGFERLELTLKHKYHDF